MGAAPPLVGVGVKVTDVPAHMVVAVEGLMLTDGITVAVTVIGIPALVAVVGEAHTALLVITAVTTSALANVVVV